MDMNKKNHTNWNLRTHELANKLHTVIW